MEALASLETARTLSEGSPFIIGSLGQVYAWSGDAGAGRKMLAAQRSRWQEFVEALAGILEGGPAGEKA